MTFFYNKNIITSECMVPSISEAVLTLWVLSCLIFRQLDNTSIKLQNYKITTTWIHRKINTDYYGRQFSDEEKNLIYHDPENRSGFSGFHDFFHDNHVSFCHDAQKHRLHELDCQMFCLRINSKQNQVISPYLAVIRNRTAGLAGITTRILSKALKGTVLVLTK